MIQVDPRYCAAESYYGTWVMGTDPSAYAHRVTTRYPRGAVRTACGRVLREFESADDMAWDACLRCVATSTRRPGALPVSTDSQVQE
jgi:hypothetical protein